MGEGFNHTTESVGGGLLRENLNYTVPGNGRQGRKIMMKVSTLHPGCSGLEGLIDGQAQVSF